MKRLLAMLVATICIMAAMTSVAFAGEWRQDHRGWWYDNGDGTYQNNGWFRDGDGKYYYFGADGYMLSNTMTPDGYYVGASGAWEEKSSSAASALPDGLYTGSLSGNIGEYNGISSVKLIGDKLLIYGNLRYNNGRTYEDGVDLGANEYVFPLDRNSQYLMQTGTDPLGYENVSQAYFLSVMQSFNGLGLTITVRNGVVNKMSFES